MNAQPDNSHAVRLLAALAVFVSHQLFLTNGQLIPVSSFHDLGWGAVMVFFALSGYLVTGSWSRDPHVGRFLMRRCLRIWPGLTLVTLVLIFILGPLMTSLPLSAYFTDPQTLRFLGHLVLMPVEVLPGVFENNFMQKVDGPLWTLPMEFGWYVLLAIAGMTLLRVSRHMVVVIWLACAFWLFFVKRVELPDVPRMFFFEFGLMFVGGVVLSVYRAWWRTRRAVVSAGLVVLAVTAKYVGHEYLAIALLLPWTVVAVATASSIGLRDVGRYGDLSYGIYIFGFPIQQTVLATLGRQTSVLGGGLIALMVTLGFAWLSWRWIEAPALRFKPASREVPVADGGTFVAPGRS
jgi:peptidoglycan/LPS O-acetylase OafA/YrhL